MSTCPATCAHNAVGLIVSAKKTWPLMQTFKVTVVVCIYNSGPQEAEAEGTGVDITQS